MKNNYYIVGIVVIIIAIFCIYYFSSSNKITNYPSKGVDIVAFGDSLIEGVGSTEGKNLVSLLSEKIGQPIVNLGHSGDTTTDGLARIKELDSYNPKVVILLLGGNDYLKKVSVEDTKKNLSIIIENIHARGAVVLLLGVRGGVLNDPFVSEFKNLKNIYHTAYVSDVLSGLIGNMNYMSDAVHPNNLGYSMIADRVYPVLEKLIK